MSNDYPADLSTYTKTFTAERVHLYVSSVLSDYPALRDHARLSEHVSQSLHEMAMQLTSWCLCGRIPSRSEHITVEWPDGVWQTFKSKFMPHWFVTRYPVRMASRQVETATHHYFVCPHLTTDPTDRHVQFMATGTKLAGQMRPR